jgi:MFS family permease
MSNENMLGKPAWILQLTTRERSALVATFCGWMLDGLDVMVYSFVLPSLVALWHISKGQAGLLGTSALLMSAAGGWAAGLAADRYGRVRVLQITIVWFAFFTFLSGFAQNYAQLFVIRGMQGLGFGGEWAVGSVLIGETVRAQFRGRAVGTTQGGWALGWGMAALFYTLFFRTLSPDTAWRAMFWIGILPALLAVWIRGHVTESDAFRKEAVKATDKSGRNALGIFAPELRRVTLLSSLVALGAQGGYYALNTFLPLYLNARGLSVMKTGVYLMVIIAGSFCGYLVSAHLADSVLGRRWTLAAFAIGSLLTIGAYTMLPIGNTVTLLLGFPLGFFPSGSFSPMGSFFTELFPTRLRGSGQGFAYNLGRGVGALFPAMVGFFSAHMRLGLAIATFAMLAYLLMVAAVLMLPETRGKELAAMDNLLP